MSSKKRQLEVKVMKFCFTKLGLPIVGEIKGEGAVLEGGDFFALGDHLCMLGVGLRSNMLAAQQLMDRDLLGTRRIALVKDALDSNQERLHLDSVFNVLSDTCCVMLETMIGEDSPMRRTVDEYTKDPATGEYQLTNEGYSILPLKAGPQAAYACNFMNLGDSRIITVDGPSAREIVKSPHFKGDVHVIDFSSITAMTGGARCACHVVSRLPRVHNIE
eukprot:gene11345-18966_t